MSISLFITMNFITEQQEQENTRGFVAKHSSIGASTLYDEAYLFSTAVEEQKNVNDFEKKLRTINIEIHAGNNPEETNKKVNNLLTKFENFITEINVEHTNSKDNKIYELC